MIPFVWNPNTDKTSGSCWKPRRACKCVGWGQLATRRPEGTFSKDKNVLHLILLVTTQGYIAVKVHQTEHFKSEHFLYVNFIWKKKNRSGDCWPSHSWPEHLCGWWRHEGRCERECREREQKTSEICVYGVCGIGSHRHQQVIAAKTPRINECEAQGRGQDGDAPLRLTCS